MRTFRKPDRTGTVPAGFSLLEAIIAITLSAMLLGIFTTMIVASFFLRRTEHDVQAIDFIQEELDTLRTLPFTELLNRTDGLFLGIPFTRGDWQVYNYSGNNALRLGTATDEEFIDESGLAVLPGNYRDNFTFTAKIRARSTSPVGWGVGLAFRYRDAENHYRYRFTANGIALDKVVQGTVTTIWSQSVTYSTGVWYELEIDADNEIIALLKNSLVLTTEVDDTFTAGDLALLALDGAIVDFDDVAVVTLAESDSWNFNSDPTGVLPAEWRRFSIFDMPDGDGTLTIEDYLGQTDMKKATVTVTWSDLTRTRSAMESTIITD